jgi:hypothetical protein
LRYVKLLFHNYTKPPDGYTEVCNGNLPNYWLLTPKQNDRAQLGKVGEDFAEGKARKLVASFEPRKAPSPPDRQEIIRNAKGKYSADETRVAIQKYLFDRTYQERASGLFTGHDSWDLTGTRPEVVVEALKNLPMAVPSARVVENEFLVHLKKTTPSYPAIIGLQWTINSKTLPGTELSEDEKKKVITGYPAGGHFVCCVGPTKDGSQFIILDPMDGVRHLNSANVLSDYIFYPNGTKIGRVNLSAKQTKPSDDTEDKWVEYLALKKYSSSGLIVTYPQS